MLIAFNALALTPQTFFAFVAFDGVNRGSFLGSGRLNLSFSKTAIDQISTDVDISGVIHIAIGALMDSWQLYSSMMNLSSVKSLSILEIFN